MFAGFDIGGTNIKSVITDETGKILKYRDTATPATAKGIDKTLADMIHTLASSVPVSKEQISAIGIGAAGSINRNKGTVITSPNVPAWDNYPICRNVEKLTGIKVYLENDATAACAGVWWHTIKNKYSNWIMLTLGTGIGGGAVIDGRLFTGQTGSSMEVGHVSLDPDGPLCPCGNRGCFELYSSATALVKYVKSKLQRFPSSTLKTLDGKDITAKKIYEEALAGDPLALEGMNHVSIYLGIGIANLINIFNPEAVIIGGGLSQASKLLFPKMKEIVKERAMKGLKENVKFIAVKEQSMIAALGAAKIARDRYNSL
jgi:glucokinase